MAHFRCQPQTPITFSYHNDSATGVDINIHFDNGDPDINGNMAGGPPDWTYTTTFSNHGKATVTYTVNTASGSTPLIFNIYIDPSGYIYNIDTEQRIAGASVWLRRPDGNGGWENVLMGLNPSVMSPDTNPFTTDQDGMYHLDVLNGTYRVHVEASGYESNDSIVVSVPPPVTDLNVGLHQIGVPKETPTINWSKPADIVYGTPLMTHSWMQVLLCKELLHIHQGKEQYSAQVIIRS